MINDQIVLDTPVIRINKQHISKFSQKYLNNTPYLLQSISYAIGVIASLNMNLLKKIILLTNKIHVMMTILQFNSAICKICNRMKIVIKIIINLLYNVTNYK